MFEQIEIPKLFRKYDDGEHFKECLSCKKNLLEDDTHYMIEKAVRNYPASNVQDVIFEYAICLDCVTTLKDEMSEESAKRIEEYFDKNLDLFQRQINAIAYQNDFNKYIESCAVTGQPSNEMNEYVMQAHCVGDKLQLSVLPLLISEKVYDDITELLSQKTIDFLDDFMDNNLGYPPEFREIFDRRLILL